jgi:hypothetical protein
MALSGWLFADLLLGIAMLFLVFNTVGAEPPPLPLPTPTTVPTYTPYPTYTTAPTYAVPPTYTPAPTYTVPPTPTSAGVDLTPFPAEGATAGFQISNAQAFVDNNSSERERVKQELHKLFDPFVGKRKAVFVITTGHTTTQRADFGNTIAGDVNELLVSEFPGIFQGAVKKASHNLTGRTGLVDFEVYFYQGGP